MILLTWGSKYIPKEQFEREIELHMIQGRIIDFHQAALIAEFQLYFNGEIAQIKFSS